MAGSGSIWSRDVVSGTVTADDLEIDSGTLSIDAANNRVGMGTTAPGTQLQVESNTPYITLKNDTSENTPGGCESRLIFEDHGNNALGQIEVSHVGTSDDEKGQLVLSTNNDSGLQAALTIDEAQKVGIGTTDPTELLTLSAADAYIALQNTSNEHTDGSAETRILFVDHSPAPLAQIEGSHSGTSDDTKGKFTISTHTGSSLLAAVTVNENQNVGIKDAAPKVSLNVIHDYQASTFENQLADGEGGGRVLRYSPGADDSLTLGQLYFLHSDGTWDSTDASAIATGGTQLLGIGLGNARTAGCLMEGFIRIPSAEIEGTPGGGAVDGLPLFVSETAGHITFTQPTTGSAFVRIVGHAIDDDSSNVLIYFNPSHNHVLL